MWATGGRKKPKLVVMDSRARSAYGPKDVFSLHRSLSRVHSGAIVDLMSLMPRGSATCLAFMLINCGNSRLFDSVMVTLLVAAAR